MSGIDFGRIFKKCVPSKRPLKGHGPVYVSPQTPVTFAENGLAILPTGKTLAKDRLKLIPAEKIIPDQPVANPLAAKACGLKPGEALDDAFWDNTFNATTMANYDAMFSDGQMPMLLNIWTHQPNQGYGYVVLHYFLQQVGQGKRFRVTDFTGPGAHLFKKAEQAGLIKQTGKQPEGWSLVYTEWEVIGNPYFYQGKTPKS